MLVLSAPQVQGAVASSLRQTCWRSRALAPAGSAGDHGQAVSRPGWRSCTFFLQSAISKRRDHADLLGGLGLGTRMNVQRRPRCTFILLTSASRGGKTLE